MTDLDHVPAWKYWPLKPHQWAWLTNDDDRLDWLETMAGMRRGLAFWVAVLVIITLVQVFL